MIVRREKYISWGENGRCVEEHKKFHLISYRVERRRNAEDVVAKTAVT